MNPDEEAVLAFLREELDAGDSIVLRAKRIGRFTDIDAQTAGNWLSRMAGRETHTHHQPRPSPFEVSVYSEPSTAVRWKVERGPPAITSSRRTASASWHHSDPDNPSQPDCRLAVKHPDVDWQQTPYHEIARLDVDGCSFCTGDYEPNTATQVTPTERLADAGLIGGASE